MFGPDILAAIRADAVRRWPEEACGFVIGDDYRPVPNIADRPRQAFMIAGTAQKAAHASGALRAVVHSHPDGWACPSAADMAQQRLWDVPWGIVVSHRHGAEAPVWFGAGAPKGPLVGRGFIHGIQDCKSLLDDWFRAHRGVHMHDMPRDWDWWHDRGENLYLAHFRTAGFRPIEEAELRPGDCVLFAVRSTRGPNHAGVIDTCGRLLHHPAGRLPVDPSRLSRHDHYERWRRYATHWMRHESCA